MGVLTNLLKLLKPGENDYYNQQTEQADNWDKVDNYAVLTNTDKNGIWGGEYGGKIQDPIPKELNKRYIDNINGKAFICIKAGDSTVTSNTTEYFTPCNVVDNLGKLQNLGKVEKFGSNKIMRFQNGKTVEILGFASAASEFINVDFGVTLKEVYRINITPVTNSTNASYPTTLFELANNSGMRVQCPFTLENGAIIKPTSLAFYWSVLGDV